MPERPPLLPGLGLYYGAFADLTTCRSDGPIPYTAIVVWLDENEIEGEDRDRTVAILRRMDAAYIGHVEKKREQDRKIAEAQAAAKKGR